MLTAGGVARRPSLLADDATRAAFWKQSVERLAVLPGCQGRGSRRQPAARRAPARRNNFDLEDHPTPPGQNQPLSHVGRRLARILQGRRAVARARPAARRTLARRRLHRRRSRLGESLLSRARTSSAADFTAAGCTTCPWTTVVGRRRECEVESGSTPPRTARSTSPSLICRTRYVVLRTAGDPAASALPLQQAVHELDPGLAVSNITTGDDLHGRARLPSRATSACSSGCSRSRRSCSPWSACTASWCTSFSSTRRDIGIRLALGGEPGDVRRLVDRRRLETGRRWRRSSASARRCSRAA